MNIIFQNIAQKSDFTIEVMESDIDHIHFLIRYIPRLSISQIVRRLKQQSTKKIWELHQEQLKKVFWYKNIFWSDGYFVCSIGEASPDTIKNYILSQGLKNSRMVAYSPSTQAMNGFYAPFYK